MNLLRLVSFAVAVSLALANYRLSEQWKRGTGTEGALRLINGKLDSEGTVLIYHASRWGVICDDLWDYNAAIVTCRQLGLGGALEHFGANYFKTKNYPHIWLDQVTCYGNEKKITDCRRNAWGDNDCNPNEAAGVRCAGAGYKAPPTYPPWNPLGLTNYTAQQLRVMARKKFRLRFIQRKTDGSGVLVATVGDVEGFVCNAGFNTADAGVACQQLGLKYASAVVNFNLNDKDLGDLNITRIHVLRYGNCRGKEKKITRCGASYASSEGIKCYVKDSDGAILGESRKVAGIRCTRAAPDLIPDVRAVETSAYLTEVPLLALICAMEENCVAPKAYRIKSRDPDWMWRNRRLMRFSAIISNEGTAEFRPFNPQKAWIWHQCHEHYHSMSIFAVYEIYRPGGRTYAAGHKASFCLEDNECRTGATKRFVCSEDPRYRGSQGISPGCKDIYLHDIDCQWIDVTELELGWFKFRFIVNPQFQVAETNFNNNAVLCDFYHSPYNVRMQNCRLVHPFDSYVN